MLRTCPSSLGASTSSCPSECCTTFPTRPGLCARSHFAKPGGHVHVYLYWWPESRLHRTVLRGVAAARRLTVRLPHQLLHLACYPLAAALKLMVVAPHTALRNRPRGRRLARALPLKTYSDYPFGVLVNDQFDRFSAPIEFRFERHEVDEMLAAAGLEGRMVLANHGWIGDGRVPFSVSGGTSREP